MTHDGIIQFKVGFCLTRIGIIQNRVLTRIGIIQFKVEFYIPRIGISEFKVSFWLPQHIVPLDQRPQIKHSGKCPGVAC